MVGNLYMVLRHIEHVGDLGDFKAGTPQKRRLLGLVRDVLDEQQAEQVGDLPSCRGLTGGFFSLLCHSSTSPPVALVRLLTCPNFRQPPPRPFATGRDPARTSPCRAPLCTSPAHARLPWPNTNMRATFQSRVATNLLLPFRRRP